MRSFRDIKRRARRDLHREMGVPALYIATPGDEPLLVHVRVHTKFTALGDQKGTNFHSAERQEEQPKIIFMVDEVPLPLHNAVVSVEPGEAYRVKQTEPRDDISITAFVTRMPEKQTEGLPVPSDG